MNTVELQKGRVVKSLAGRDSGYLLVIMQADEKSVLVCDGKERPIDRPKSKNIRHVEALDYVLDSQEISTDRALRKALKRIDAEICDKSGG